MFARIYAWLFGGKLASLDFHKNHITTQIEKYRTRVSEEQASTNDAIVTLTDRLSELKRHAQHQF